MKITYEMTHEEVDEACLEWLRQRRDVPNSVSKNFIINQIPGQYPKVNFKVTFEEKQ